ncbi:hypothetical protein NG701_12440 [Pseudarthrobacter sp. HLT3-5]|uniref:hypothetical protein n=1 Tax=Pseudarthrobacter cellobiosi TaxID=2953654 RepID=UPI00208EEFBE|nr:hypothetical protein [Pseudarthrobacter sp. HLT3-5]MCO4275228.1 hypothetical protein [Pseudarthrobacter sp. HLT3-5]
MNQLRVDDSFSNALRAELVSRVEKTSHSRARKPARLWLAAGALAGAAILGGVAAGVLFPSSQQISPQPSALASYKPEDTLAAFSGLSHDYDPVRSPEALAALSQLIVQGTVDGVREGRTGTGTNTIVLIVDTDHVVRGELSSGNDGNVYLELPAGGHPDPSCYTKAFPEGAAVVAYMVAAAPDGQPAEGTDVKIENPKAGRPDGQALYLPAGPQGLALQVGKEDVVWPLTGARSPGKLADTLPGGGLIAE